MKVDYIYIYSIFKKKKKKKKKKKISKLHIIYLKTLKRYENEN